MNVIFEGIHGSRLYGTDTAESDLDIKKVFIPEPRKILLQKTKQVEHLQTEEQDLEIFSLDRFVELLVQGQTVAIECLFAKSNINHPTWDRLVENKNRFLSRNIGGMVGFAKSQACRYSQKTNRIEALKRAVSFLEKLAEQYTDKAILVNHMAEVREFVAGCPQDGTVSIISLVDNFNIAHDHLDVIGKKSPDHSSIAHALGVYRYTLDRYGKRAGKAVEMNGMDWKSLLHALRVSEEALELIETGNLVFPRKNAQYLLSIKRGEVAMDEILNQVDDNIDRIDKVSSSSVLRPIPDHKFAEDFICEVYRDGIMESWS